MCKYSESKNTRFVSVYFSSAERILVFLGGEFPACALCVGPAATFVACGGMFLSSLFLRIFHRFAG